MKLIDEDLKPAYGCLQVEFRNDILLPKNNEVWKLSIRVWNLVWSEIGSRVFRETNKLQILTSFNE